jgi:uncharacterized protein (TIGR02246 family)
MLKKSIFVAPLVLALALAVFAQNSNTGAGAPKQSNANRRAATPAKRPAASSDSAESRAVRAAFDSLVDGIRRADAEAVMKLFWNSPQLIVFNNNGTVTKGWDQVHSNRQSLYAKVKDVKLDVRDVHTRLLGPTAALVTCLWDQSQTADGQPEHATGRLTIVYEKIGGEWKIVHTHTSPDRPSPSNLLPSERTTGAGGTTPTKP